MSDSLLSLAATFLDEYADRLGNDGCNDWDWPPELTADEKRKLAGDDWEEEHAPPNWLAVRNLSEILRKAGA